MYLHLPEFCVSKHFMMQYQGNKKKIRTIFKLLVFAQLLIMDGKYKQQMFHMLDRYTFQPLNSRIASGFAPPSPCKHPKGTLEPRVQIVSKLLDLDRKDMGEKFSSLLSNLFTIWLITILILQLNLLGA